MLKEDFFSFFSFLSFLLTYCCSLQDPDSSEHLSQALVGGEGGSSGCCRHVGGRRRRDWSGVTGSEVPQNEQG